MKSLSNAGLNIALFQSQTMDGAGNKAGCQSGCTTQFLKDSPRAAYHYCFSHDLNLALCKSCQIKEIATCNAEHNKTAWYIPESTPLSVPED